MTRILMLELSNRKQIQKNHEAKSLVNKTNVNKILRNKIEKESFNKKIM